MSVVAIIGARSGSKGVRDKNIRHLGGHPLLALSVVAAFKSKLIDEVVVSTDSEAYADIARQYGASVRFMRPEAISGDDSTDHDYIAHALNWIEVNQDTRHEFVVQLRPTTPLRSPDVIDAAIEVFQRVGRFSALRSVHEMSESAYKCFEIDGSRLVTVCSGSSALDRSNDPRQSFPLTYHANGYVDVLRADIIKRGLLHGNCVYPYITYPAVEIDTESDFALAEYQVLRNPRLVEDLFS